jgi:outer membrane receptor protein involved in Fe transport
LTSWEVKLFGINRQKLNVFSMNKSLLTVIACLLSGYVLAQTAALTGTIIDESSSEPLIGATILLEETGTGTVTDFDGKYQIQAEPGVYTITYSYVGYASQTFNEVELIGGETRTLDVVMSDGAVELELDVTVTAKSIDRTSNAVLLLQKKSDKIQDGISSQEISNLGAGTAAAALTKVTGTTIVDGKYVYVRGLGDRYSTTALNGTRLPSIDPYRNSAQLDLIPSNLLDNIIAAKTFTPDLPGDFTGGYVDIKMKTLPERFTYGISVSGSYNTQATNIDNFLTFDAGDQAWLGFNDGTLDKPAALNNPALQEQEILSATGAVRARSDDDVARILDEVADGFSPEFAPSPKATSYNHSVSFNLGNQFQIGGMPVGFLLTGNYSRDFQHYSNALNANYQFLGGGEESLQNIFNLRDTRSIESPSLGGLAGLSFRPSPNNQISLYAIYSHQTEQEARFLDGDYREYGIVEPLRTFQSRTLGFTQREMLNYIANGEHAFGTNGMKLEWAASFIEAAQNEPDLRFFANTFEPDRDFYAIATSLYLAPGHYYRELDDQSFNGKIDFTLPILQSRSKANKIKIGGAYQTQTRSFTENIYNVLRRNGMPYAGDPAAYFGDENAGVVGQTEAGRNIIGLFISDDTLLPSQYEGETTVAAGYGMLTYQLTNKLKFIGGGRVETTDYYVESAAAEVSPNPEFFLAEIDEIDFLPSANLIYALNDNTNLRLSYSRTLARPNMREVAPFASFGFIGDPPVIGNPMLERTKISNFDIRYEIFSRPGELFAISGFYKEFVDPIVVTFLAAGNPQFTWTNTEENAQLFGGEIEFRKNLDVISPALANFNFSTNLAYIYSRVDLNDMELSRNRDVDPEFPDSRPFAGQSPWVGNANLSYNNRDNGWNGILAFNFFTDRLYSIGTEGTPDSYERGRPTLDLSISKQLGNFTVKLRGQNLLDPRYERYMEFRGQEYLLSQFQRGRTVSLGLSYGF